MTFNRINIITIILCLYMGIDAVGIVPHIFVFVYFPGAIIFSILLYFVCLQWIDNNRKSNNRAANRFNFIRVLIIFELILGVCLVSLLLACGIDGIYSQLHSTESSIKNHLFAFSNIIADWILPVMLIFLLNMSLIQSLQMRERKEETRSKHE